MYHVDRIWFHGTHLKNGLMKVIIKSDPGIEIEVDVPVPQPFHDAIVRMAKAGADVKMADVQAHMLGEKNLAEHIQPPPPQPPAPPPLRIVREGVEVKP